MATKVSITESSGMRTVSYEASGGDHSRQRGERAPQPRLEMGLECLTNSKE